MCFRKCLIVFFVSLALAFFFGACAKRTICPAFQSAFIYDEEALRKKFSYFDAGYIPKKLAANKTRHLIITPKSYQRRMKALQTVEMKKIYPVLDSLQIASSKEDFMDVQEQDSLFDEGDLVSFVSDSSANDSTSGNELAPLATGGSGYYEITLAKEKYNTDQDNYMWYMRNILVLPDVRIALYKGYEKSKEKLDTQHQEEKQPKNKKSSFGNVFQQKNKTDSLALPKPSSTDIE